MEIKRNNLKKEIESLISQFEKDNNCGVLLSVQENKLVIGLGIEVQQHDKQIKKTKYPILTQKEGIDIELKATKEMQEASVRIMPDGEVEYAAENGHRLWFCTLQDLFQGYFEWTKDKGTKAGLWS